MQKLTLNHLLNADLTQDKALLIPQIQKSNFRKAFYILPKSKQIAINNFYLFCAYLDDVVDNPANRHVAPKRINHWKNIIKRMEQNDVPNTLEPLHMVFKQYNIDYKLVSLLIEGIERDLYQNRYNTFDEMLNYCYGVASVVGLVCIQLFVDTEVKPDNLKHYAVNLGYALQITNIMRDIGEDYARNYIYIPQELLKQFNYSEKDIKNKVYNQNFFYLMEHLYEKAMQYYGLAKEYYVDDKNLRVAQCMRDIYYKLLQKIKRHNYKIYEKKIRISTVEKIIILLKWCLK